MLNNTKLKQCKQVKANTQTSKITLGIEQKYLHIKAAVSFNIHILILAWLNEN